MSLPCAQRAPDPALRGLTVTQGFMNDEAEDDGSDGAGLIVSILAGKEATPLAIKEPDGKYRLCAKMPDGSIYPLAFTRDEPWPVETIEI